MQGESQRPGSCPPVGPQTPAAGRSPTRGTRDGRGAKGSREGESRGAVIAGAAEPRGMGHGGRPREQEAGWAEDKGRGVTATVTDSAA